MMFDKQKALSVLQRKEVLFSTKINPVEVLPYLCSMTEMSKQEIASEQRNYGEKRATSLLLKRIRQQDKCVVEFIKALRDSDILQTELADMLDPYHLIDSGQQCSAGDSRDVKRKDETKSQLHDGDTPIRHLDCGIMKFIKRLDYDEKWKNLAEYLGYTIEEVQQLQTIKGSCTEKLIEEWSSGDKHIPATVDSLFTALDMIGREDIITDLQLKINYRYTRKSQLCDDSQNFIDLQSEKTDRSRLETDRKEDRERKSEPFLDLSSHKNVNHFPIDIPHDKSSVEVLYNRNEDYVGTTTEIDVNTQTFSIENNVLQSHTNRNGVLHGINEIVSEELPESINNESCREVDSDRLITCENNNMKFTEKNMKDKVIDNVKGNPLLLGASLVGAISLGMFMFNRST